MTVGPGAASTRAALEAAWARSDAIFSLVAGDALLARPIALRQPFLFYVGHLPAFAWNHLGRGVLGRPSFAPSLDALFERGIDPPDDGEAPREDPAGWPPLREVLAYRDRVREEVRAFPSTPAVEEVLPMVLEHELMHHETLLYMVQALPAERKLRPAWLPPPRPFPAGAGAGAPLAVRVPAGQALLGAPRDGAFRWDNEHPELRVPVDAFTIDATPVTNRQMEAFVEAGGYRRRDLWSDDAWAWLSRRGDPAPPTWRTGPAGRTVKALLEEIPFERAAGWPASVTQCEAAAYARWAGGRLPTEAELHRAAFGTPSGALREHPWGDEPPAPRHGNLGFVSWNPVPVGSHPAGASAWGVEELVGNGWEWTSTEFGPFPGFRPLARYPGYSADFFDGRHVVLLGASWATDRRLVRRSFRNWFQVHYGYVFSKFRCVRPA